MISVVGYYKPWLLYDFAMTIVLLGMTYYYVRRLYNFLLWFDSAIVYDIWCLHAVFTREVIINALLFLRVCSFRLASHIIGIFITLDKFSAN